MTLYAIARHRFPLLLIILCCLAFPAKSFARPVIVAVIGDSIATELGRGMQKLFAHDRHVRVIKRTKFSTGLVRTDYFNWNRAAARFLARHRVDKIVVVMGGNDRQSVNVGHRRLERFSRAWRRDYRRRVAHFMRILKRAHAKVYWVGLPQVASREMTRDYRILNSIYQPRGQAPPFHLCERVAHLRQFEGRLHRLRPRWRAPRAAAQEGRHALHRHRQPGVRPLRRPCHAAALTRYYGIERQRFQSQI